jgi:phosphoglycolate phosphatase
MIRLVVFDLDGTLVDSRRDLAESANLLLEQCGGAVLPEEAIGRMVGDGAAALVARAFAASGCPQPHDALARFLAIYDERLLNFTRPYDGIDQTLTRVRERAAVAVLTNKPLRSTQRILDGLGLARHFDAGRVLGGDGPFPRKPDPAGLRHLAAIDNAPLAATLMVGDSLIDWRVARAAGSRVCLARYGFGFEGFPVDELSAEEPAIDRPEDLLKVL